MKMMNSIVKQYRYAVRKYLSFTYKPSRLPAFALLILTGFTLQSNASTATSLTEALSNCTSPLAANKPNLAVPLALVINGSKTGCSDVTISTSDLSDITRTAPLIPVVIGSGGTLTLVEPAAGDIMTLYATSFRIKNGGVFKAGSPSSPVEQQINIIMLGSSSASLAPNAVGASNIVKNSNKTANSRDITVASGGTLAFYGGKGLSGTPNGTDNNPITSKAFRNNQYGTNSWTFLAKPAGPESFDNIKSGSSQEDKNSDNISSPVPVSDIGYTLTLAKEVDWAPGDWISVSTTSFTSHQTEIVRVCKNTKVDNPDTKLTGNPKKVSEITLSNGSNCGISSSPKSTYMPATPLKHYHYGGNAPTPGFYKPDKKKKVVTGGKKIDVGSQAKSFYNDHSRNFGIDERAVVSLLSRNIKLSSVANSDFMGGHLVVESGATKVDLVGVEIEKFGQPFVGRYPVHLHHAMTSGSNVLIQDVSVHHSYNKCFVVHHTQSAKFYNNVCVRTVGQGVYLEDGVGSEQNQFVRNHVAGTMAANSTYSYPAKYGSTYWNGDYLQQSHSGKDWYTISGIPDTSKSGENCIASHCSEPGPDTFHPGGFWITNLNNVFVNNAVSGCQAQGRGYWLLSQGGQPATAYPEFTGNRAHACYNGLDTAPDSINNTSNPYPIFGTETHSITSVSQSVLEITSDKAFPIEAKVPIMIGGGGGLAKGDYTVSKVTQSGSEYVMEMSYSPAFNGYSSGNYWQLSTLPVQVVDKVSDTSYKVKVPAAFKAAIPDKNSMVTLTGFTSNTAVNGTWKITSVDLTSPLPSFTFNTVSALSGSFPTKANQGNWQASKSNDILSASMAPKQLETDYAPTVGQQVTLSNGGSNEAIFIVATSSNAGQSGSFTVTDPGTNPLDYAGGTWQETAQPPVLLLNDNVVTRSRNRGFWGRSIFLTLHNNRFATNPYGVSLAGGGGPEGNYIGYWDLAHQNVFAGMTRNNVERYPAGCTYQIDNAVTASDTIVFTTNGAAPLNGSEVIITGVNGIAAANGKYTVTAPASGQATNSFSIAVKGTGAYTSGGVAKNTKLDYMTECTDVVLKNLAKGWGNFPNPDKNSTMNIQGYSYYDGPARIEHNRFVNFRYDPTGIHDNTPEARLLTKTDIRLIETYASLGQLHGAASPGTYGGYPGDSATGWIQSNAQTVPPTQYIKDSIWDNTDFKHQVYTEAVNLGAFNDGDKTTIILDKDSRLSGLAVVDSAGTSNPDFVPVSLNSIDYYATDFTVDEPHARGPNNFRESSLMSPHKYATLNIESVYDPSPQYAVRITRDMPAYGDNDHPSLFLNGRGQKPIFEPFVMDRMGYTINAVSGTEHLPLGYSGANHDLSAQTPVSLQEHLLFSYTDPSVKTAGEFFVNRIAVYQPLASEDNIAIYRIRRQWGQPYLNAWPPGYQAPGPVASTCDSTFFSNQTNAAARWQDCLARGKNLAPPSPYTGAPAQYSGGVKLSAASNMTEFETPYSTLLTNMKAATTTADKQTALQTFISGQTYYYDSSSHMLYFYMIEDSPVDSLTTPYGTCGGGTSGYKANVQKILNVKTFSNQDSVKSALNTSCLVDSGEPVPTDLVTCGSKGCAAYIVDLTKAEPSVPDVTLANAITGASNTNPIVVSSTNPPKEGDTVLVSGVGGNTKANGYWTVSAVTTDSFTLEGSKGNAEYISGGQWQLIIHGEKISRTEYAKDNEFHFVYATPVQQANGLPVPPAVNNAPPASGTSVSNNMVTVSDNQIEYQFLTIPGATVTVNENFPYRCLTNPSWSPVNPSGQYTPPEALPCPKPGSSEHTLVDFNKIPSVKTAKSVTSKHETAESKSEE